ncbi:MAG TPA: DUF6263 family protein [Verrucomicrobiae bacterium]
MKKIVVVLSLCAVAGCVLLSGCSKSKNSVTAPGNNADSTETSATADRPAEMKIKWTVGKKYVMRMEFNQGTETTLPNQTQPMKSEVNLAQDFDFSALKALDNGGRQLELEFVDETMDVSQGDRKVLSFDSAQSSAQDTNNPIAPMLRLMVGARLQYFTDANGAVQKVEGMDDLMNRVAATAKPQQQAMFKQMFSEDTLKKYGSFADMMPNRMVNVGESWSVKKDTTSAIGVLTIDMKYTFKNWEQHADRKCAHIEMAGDISTKSTSNASGAVIEIEKGKISGDVWFDPELGMIVETDSDQNITMKVTTRTQTMTPQMTQKIRLTLVDVQ